MTNDYTVNAHRAVNTERGSSTPWGAMTGRSSG